MSTDRIYLDYAASAPIRSEAIAAMNATYASAGFNPSSLHAQGRQARAELDRARERVAAVLGAVRKEITFTAGGTEADHLALVGTVRALGGRGHVVVSAIEHHAVLRAADELADMGCDVTLVPVDGAGRVVPEAFAAALHDTTVLASIAYANNEIGTVQPIAELAAIAHRRGVSFHTDAVQAAGWLPIDVAALGVDLLSLSAHKFGGPKGVGVLYVRAGTPVVPVVPGGGQEFGRRSGTENVAGAAGAAVALDLAAAERESAAARVAGLRDRLEAGIVARIAGVRVHGREAPRLPGISSVGFPGAGAQALLMRLDLEGVAVSAGSACTSGTLEPSHVIRALGVDPAAQATIRFSLGRHTTPAEVERVLAILPRAVEAARNEPANGDVEGSDRTASARRTAPASLRRDR